MIYFLSFGCYSNQNVLFNFRSSVQDKQTTPEGKKQSDSDETPSTPVSVNTSPSYRPEGNSLYVKPLFS